MATVWARSMSARSGMLPSCRWTSRRKRVDGVVPCSDGVAAPDAINGSGGASRASKCVERCVAADERFDRLDRPADRDAFDDRRD